MDKDSLKFLERLIEAAGPAGAELPVQRVWLERVRKFSVREEIDAYGNCVAILPPGGRRKASARVMLAAHADEIGMRVAYVDEHGFVYVRRVGGVNPSILRGQRVHIHTARGIVSGVIGVMPPHFKREEKDEKPPRLHELFIDIGAPTRKRALELVDVGDPVTLAAGFELLGQGYVVGRALDNRVGLFAVAEVMRRLWPERNRLHVEVVAVSNVQEEVGLYGARQVAYTLKPDAAIVVDVTHATDYPGVSKTQHGEVFLGRGPTLTRGGSNHPDLFERMRAVAARARIPVQLEAVSATSGTDADVVFWTRGGIPTLLVSIPCRYMHSPVEMVSLSDLDSTVRLLVAFMKALGPEERFAVKL